MRASLKLALQFDAALPQGDLREITADAFVAHFNTRYYRGDWSVAPIRSVGVRADHIYPDPTAKNAFADTPLLERCPYVRHVLASFPCPHLPAPGDAWPACHRQRATLGSWHETGKRAPRLRALVPGRPRPNTA
jgi:hypothetical protein